MNSPYNVRPKPDDFDEMLMKLGSQIAARKYYKTSAKAIRRWIKNETGPVPQFFHPAPADFCKLAQTMCKNELVKHYHRSHTTIARWARLNGIKPAKPNLERFRREVPDDFLRMAPTMLKTELLEHYSVSWETLQRWFAETGAPSKKYRPAAHMRLLASRSPAPIPSRGLGNERRPERAYGPEDQAADVLRRYGPVYRCDERGRMEPKGRFWRVGVVICDGPELMARAARKEKAA